MWIPKIGYVYWWVIIGSTMKKCYKCSKNKDLTEFYKDKSRWDGKKPLCKECSTIDILQYNKTHKEEQKIYDLMYNIKNKELKRQKWKINYQNNKEVLKKLSYKKNKCKGYGVYMLFHKPTQYYYIGEGWLYVRRMGHFSTLKRGVNGWGHIQKIYNKYPNVDEWEFKVLKKWEHMNKDEGLYFERLLINEGIRNNPKKLLNKNISGIKQM